MDDILQEVTKVAIPFVVQATGVVLAGALSWLAIQVQRRTGLTIEAQRREALHSAIMTGVAAASQKLGAGASPKSIAQEAVVYAKKSVPDAIQALGPSAEVLTTLALSKLEQILAVRAAPAVAVIEDRPAPL